MIFLLLGQQSAEAGLLKALGGKLKSYPRSLCDTVQDCTDMVKSGHAAFTGVYILSVIIISNQ